MELKRTWLYCRAAHNGPDSLDVLAAQQHRLEAYAKEYGLEIVGSSNDIGSGLTFAHRPGLLDFHAAVEDGTVDILLLVDLARLSRDLDKTMQYWCLLRDLNVSIYTVNSGKVNLSIAAILRKMIEE